MKNLTLSILLFSVMIIVFGLIRPFTAYAATSPVLTDSASYSVLAGSTVTNTGSTTTNGNVGVSPGTAITGFPPGVAGPPGTTHSNDASAIAAQADNLTVFGTLDQSCNQTFGAVDLTATFPAGVGPGVYCSTSSFSLTGNLNLIGSGVWIFKTVSTLITSPGSSITGGDPCNIWWRIGSSATLDTTTSFIGNIFALTSITLNTGATLNGRALAQNAAVTLSGNSITGPTCTPVSPTLHVIKHLVLDNGGTAAASDWTLTVASSNSGTGTGSAVGAESPGSTYTLQAGKAYSVTESSGPSGYISSSSSDCSIASAVAATTYTCTITNDDIAPGVLPATINVVKTVINDNGGIKTIADFPLFVNATPVVSGVTNTFPTNGGVYTVTEISDPNYIRTFSGDCDANGQLNLNQGNNKFCIVTNNDIGAPAVPPAPPLIDVVKVPNPLALPAGPGSVKYTYTLKNIGTVPVTDVTMVGDTCSPIILVSGDTNADSKLNLNETWKYTCSTTLASTHTNTVVATGWANGISATDIASATVIVGIPVVPPLIHVTKIPNPLALSAFGGSVIYTEKITNPGTVALSQVGLVDDKCSPVNFVSGDTNMDSKLDPSETWVYTCQTNLSQTTTNTAVATGQANGLTVRDFAIATVVVAAPGFPNAGIPPQAQSATWIILLLAGILMIVSTSLLILVLRKGTV